MLAVAGLLRAAIKQEARCKSDAFMQYIRTNTDDAGRTSRAMVMNAPAGSAQPGQGMIWECVGGESTIKKVGGDGKKYGWVVTLNN